LFRAFHSEKSLAVGHLHEVLILNNLFYIVISSFVISGFRRDVDENCAVLGYYAASSGNSLPTFRDNLWVHLQGSRIQKGFSLQGPRTQK